jgi:POT family proton-dependent oligopeptide transporter
MSTPNSSKHPKGLYFLFIVGMWERFNYYGMRALLALFMISAVLGFDKADAANIYGWFTALVFLTPVIGGYLADRFIGKGTAIVLGAALMAAGQFSLAAYGVLPVHLSFFAGLLLIAVGNGFFKSASHALVGDLYGVADRRRDSAFTIFYMGINLGALIAPLVCGYLGQTIAWKWGFVAAGIGMLISLAIYLAFYRKYLGNVNLKPYKSVAHKTNNTNNQSSVSQGHSGDSGVATPLTKEDRDKIKAIFVFTFISVFFWAFFEQAGTSLTFFADESTRLPVVNLFGWEIKVQSTFFQAINPLFILLLGPLFTLLWAKLGRREPSTPSKFAWGLLAQGVAFAVMAVGAAVYLGGGKAPVSMMWLVMLYFFCSVGELCLSPIGMSMVTKLAPVRFMSLLMGVWLASSFFGNLLAGWLASYYEEWALTTLFSVPAVCSVLFAAIMWIMTRKVKQWMHGVA